MWKEEARKHGEGWLTKYMTEAVKAAISMQRQILWADFRDSSKNVHHVTRLVAVGSNARISP